MTFLRSEKDDVTSIRLSFYYLKAFFMLFICLLQAKIIRNLDGRGASNKNDTAAPGWARAEWIR
jgi:hypothetical protein